MGLAHYPQAESIAFGLTIHLHWWAWPSHSLSARMSSFVAPYLTFLEILTAQHQSAPANELWHALAAQKFKFPVEQAFPYFDYLINTQQVDQAEEVWKFLGELDSQLPEDPTKALRRYVVLGRTETY